MAWHRKLIKHFQVIIKAEKKEYITKLNPLAFINWLGSLLKAIY